MRWLLGLLAFAAAPAVVSQTPPRDQGDLEIVLETPEGLFKPFVYEMRNDKGEIEKRVYVPPEILKNEKAMDSLRKQGLTPVPGSVVGGPSCEVDYSDIAAEQKASDARLRQMRRREEVIPLQHQYEQELYYKDRYAKRREEQCGKSPAPKPGGVKKRLLPESVDLDEMTRKACQAIDVVCKPVKHW